MFWGILLTLSVVCCTRPDTPAPTPEPDPTPVTPVNPEPTPAPQAKPRFVWIDASANFRFYANDKAYIAKELRQVADCGFSDIVVDVRPTCGDVLFRSTVAPELKYVPAWFNGEIGLKERTATFDYLAAFIESVTVSAYIMTCP